MNSRNKYNPKYKLGLALSGGGIKGLSHAGILKALAEFDIKPDIISGTSAGSIVAALYADGHSPDMILSFFEDVTFTQMAKLGFPDGGFFSLSAFEDFLASKLRAKTFEDLKIPIRIVATDLDHGQSVVFSSGELIEPIIASCSLPILFFPKKINGTTYVDGGVFKNFPVSTIRNKCEFVIGGNCSPLMAKEYKINLLNIATRSYHFMFAANSILDQEMCDLLIEPKYIGDYTTFDVEKSGKIFDLGYSTTKELLNSDKGLEFLEELKQAD